MVRRSQKPLRRLLEVLLAVPQSVVGIETDKVKRDVAHGVAPAVISSVTATSSPDSARGDNHVVPGVTFTPCVATSDVMEETDMSEYTDDVARYTDSVDEDAVAGIVKHLGIALRSSKDAALVACSDASERDRVRDSWLKKKLGLQDDAALDADVMAVCAQMKEDREKSRVTFYYLLADKHGKLADLH